VTARSSTSREETSAQPPAYGRGRRSKVDPTNMKTETKMQKRTRILDSYRFDEKIHEKTISD
jgi:hypothetical protein